ncbi:hypothetical protein C8J57DRAFT_1301908, partial [Mycena rebaudengoi]
PAMPSLAAVKASNAAFSSAYLPVAIFAGGTSGIGRAAAEAFARYTNGNAHIIIIGRNKQAAESILASFPKPETKGWQHEFVACDTSLMGNIGAVSSELLKRVPKIHFLVLSFGYMSWLGRKETTEGIDDQLAVRYYGRWKLIHELLPALREATKAGEPSKVLSILDTGYGGAVTPDDFGLRKKYSGMAATKASSTYNDLALEEFALRDPDIAFTHISPGFVKTPLFTGSKHWAMKIASPVLKPLVSLGAITPERCAEYMLYALINSEKGFSRRTDKGDDAGKNIYASVEARVKLWDHTVQEVAVKKTEEA